VKEAKHPWVSRYKFELGASRKYVENITPRANLLWGRKYAIITRKGGNAYYHTVHSLSYFFVLAEQPTFKTVNAENLDVTTYGCHTKK
jgi:hypothetical protein